VTLDMFNHRLIIKPYRESSRCVSVLDAISIAPENTYRKWCEGAIEELESFGYWYLILYHLNPKVWTLFYWRKKLEPVKHQIFPGARQTAFDAGRCGQIQEHHFFDLDIGRPTVDYGRNVNTKKYRSRYQ